MHIITGSLPREVEYRDVMVPLPHQYFPPDEKYSWTLSYLVLKEDKDTAKKLSSTLFDLLFAGGEGALESPEVVQLLSEIKAFRRPQVYELPNQLQWDRVAEHVPQDIAGRYKEQISEIFSSCIYGATLEAFAGFNSYLFPSINREVTAHDFSERMLLKYEYPKRRRILFDVDTLPEKKFEFSSELFDTILFVKAYKYVKNPIEVFREFLRLLKPGGRLLFLESTVAGYHYMVLRTIKPRVCTYELRLAGFDTTSVKLLPFGASDREEMVLFEAWKL
jgi:hypothetical protein